MRAARLATKKAKKGAVDMSDLISQSEAARLRGVSRNAINYLVREGRLSTAEVGGRTFVYKSEVEAFKPGKPGPKGKGRQGEACRSRHSNPRAEPRFCAQRGTSNIHLQARASRLVCVSRRPQSCISTGFSHANSNSSSVAVSGMGLVHSALKSLTGSAAYNSTPDES